MSFNETNWSFSNNSEWERKFTQCSSRNNSKQSPINIDTNNLKEIGNLRSLGILYGNSKCFVMNKNNTPTIKYDPGSYINFSGVLYELSKITLHTPSMHTINGDHYDMEICLYHCANPSDCSSGGVIISILAKRGKDSSPQNMFFSQFINQIPKGETKFEVEIPVSSSWNVMDILPNMKSFFYYEGSYPMPPCKPNWKWIIFEEPIVIGKTNFETFELVIKYTDRDGNIRIPTKPLGSRNVFYQSSPHLVVNDKIAIENIKEQIKNLQKRQKELEEQDKARSGYEVSKETKERKELNIQKHHKTRFSNWYEENKLYIKGIIITIILILVIFTGLKIAKTVIMGGFMTRFMENEISKAEQRKQIENELKQKAVNEQMGPPPPQQPQNINNTTT